MVKNSAHNTSQKTHFIETGVFEVVANLQALGLYTTASCEGHLDHGIAGPWVDVEAAKDTIQLEKRLSALWDKVQECQANKKSKDQCAILHRKRHLLFNRIRQIHIKEQAKLITLLAGFYHRRRVPFDVRLHVAEIFANGGCRLESQGINLQEIRSPKDREVKLKQYQAEMIAFGEYLKTHLAEISHQAVDC